MKEVKAELPDYCSVLRLAAINWLLTVLICDFAVSSN